MVPNRVFTSGRHRIEVLGCPPWEGAAQEALAPRPSGPGALRGRSHAVAGRHPGPLLLAAILAGGCAGLAPSPNRFYRVSGMASTSTPFGAEEGAQSYLVQLDGNVQYTIEVAMAAGDMRVRTTLRNGGRDPVLYDLQRAVVVAADGRSLRLIATDEDPSVRPPTGTEGAWEDHHLGVRTIAPGEREAITRRYTLADGLRGGGDLLLLARLSLEDVVRIGDREVPVRLRFEKEG